jgi:hypothetical protein
VFKTLKEHDPFITAIATVVIALYTFVLAKVGRRQAKDTRILQRAYVSVEPNGIRTNTGGELIGHVVFHNVGHLPANEFSWALMAITPSSDGEWVPPAIPVSAFEGHNVLPIGAKMTKGGPGIWQYEIQNLLSETRPSICTGPQEEYLYVWGSVTYMDGFGDRRFTNFCHRYNWAIRTTMPGGVVELEAEFARYHERGNDAD